MPTNVIMPQMGESIFEGTVTRWLKAPGEPVTRDEPLFEISTDKVDSEIPAPASGILSEIRVKEGETVQVNTVVAVIGDDRPVAATPDLKESTVPVFEKSVAQAVDDSKIAQAEVRPEAPAIRYSPLVKRIAKEENVDLKGLEGTGLGGRVTKKDILSYLSERQKESPPTPSVALRPPADAEVARGIPEGRVEVVPMSGMRRSIAEHMINSQRISAHATTVFEVDMSRIVALKQQQEAEFLRREGVKLSYVPFFIKVVAEALKKFPILNASVADGNIVYKKDINIGVAVALDWGLIVPVIKNADEKNFLGLSRAAADLADRARRKKLTPEDVQNGTFTITNPGIFGSVLGAPIINQPQVGILCVGAISKRPVIINDAIAIRSMVYLTLTFDHRLIDGAVADQFMAGIKAKLAGWDEELS
ncbi:MAG TPA: dihydrolipoamide acetyltransferase family protein [Terriglobia bacterium]|nr:dihydrolipoamide acetyltransferase family protein [Terriglobia bacterium]